jgi:hypothetical protein
MQGRSQPPSAAKAPPSPEMLHPLAHVNLTFLHIELLIGAVLTWSHLTERLVFGSLVGEGVHRVKWVIKCCGTQARRCQESTILFCHVCPNLSRPRSPARCEAAGGVEHVYLTTHADDGMVLSSLVALLAFGSLILNFMSKIQLTLARISQRVSSQSGQYHQVGTSVRLL